jgi:hypothetical protein
MSAVVSFERISMCWNAYNVKPFYFDNTMEVSADEPLEHLMAWTAAVAHGAPGGKLKALVINCHGWYGANDYTSVLDSAGGIPRVTGGIGLNIGAGGIGSINAGGLFKTLEGLVPEIHIYGCGAAKSYIASTGELVQFCQIIADAGKAVVVAADETQPDIPGPGLNLAPPMVGRVMRFTPSA